MDASGSGSSSAATAWPLVLGASDVAALHNSCLLWTLQGALVYLTSHTQIWLSSRKLHANHDGIHIRCKLTSYGVILQTAENTLIVAIGAMVLKQ